MTTWQILKVYLKETKGYRLYYISYFLSILVISTEPSFFGIARNWIIDNLKISDFTIDYYITPVAFFGIMLFLYEIAHISRIWTQKKALPNVNKRLMITLYDSIQNSNYEFFQKNTNGSIISKIRNILSNFDDLIGDITDGFITDPIKIISSTFLIFYINKYLGLLVCSFLIIFVIFCSKILLQLGHVKYLEENNYNDLIGRINDRLLNIFTIFSFTTFKKERRILENDLNKNYLPYQNKVYDYEIKFHIVGGIIYSLMILCPVAFSLYLYLNKQITLGNFIAIWTFSGTISISIWDLLRSIQYIIEEISELKSSLTVLEETNYNSNIIENNENKEKLVLSEAPIIEFKDVTFNYNNDSENDFILKNFNLKINKGEKIGVVGKSGTGKSTLFSLLLKYNVNYNGEILIDGKDLSNIETESLRNNISIIPQDTILFNRSIIDNIKYSCENINDEVVHDICKKIKIHDDIMKLPDNYNYIVGERGLNISGGQRQRISIARAFLKHSNILLLDEPTSALDAITEKYFQESLNALLNNRDCTTIIIAHKLMTLVNMDRIIVLDEGRIIDQGTHEQLLQNKNSYYTQLWNIQMGLL